MKNVKMFKKLVIVMLSLVLVAVCSGKVLAADDDVFTTVNSANSATSTTDNGTFTTVNSTNSATSTTDNKTAGNNTSLTTNSSNTATRNTTNNVATSNTSRNVTNTNTLAKTGLSNTSGIIALIVVVCAVSAIYSYKKVNDYKKL